ncbi:MAG: hypothetical protein RR540_02600 [Oscillospiraceae bacterium]
MDLKTMAKSKICSEFSAGNFVEWFSRKRDCFVNHIDTLYYVVYPACEWKEDIYKKQFCEYIKSKKALAEEVRESVKIFEEIDDNIEVKPYFGFQMYNLHFGRQDCFDVFVCENPPTPQTPPIIVQLRSQFLWLWGSRNAFDVSCDIIEAVLLSFGIEILKVQENRIDYAFHTNYIQDIMNFFPETCLKKMQISNFERWHKEGKFCEDDTLCDYFVLGRRKSNNVFFRVYNKTQEVIENGYKQFFIPLWESEGLISKFDKYILEKAFVSGTYESKEKARCEFYLSYGSDFSAKLDIQALIDNPDTPINTYKRFADKLVPDLTIITNVEYQTKRKFYDRLDISRKTMDRTYKSNIYNLFECYSSIIAKLTTDTLRFVRYKGEYGDMPRLKRPTASWWQALQRSKSLEFDDEQLVMIIRTYQNNLDIERRKHLALSGIASNVSCLSGVRGSPFENDMYDMIANLNDNDLNYYYRRKAKSLKDLKMKGLIGND